MLLCNPDKQVVWATRLNNLGIIYNGFGQREKALEASNRAVEIRERLAERNLDAFEPDLAMSLGALGAISRNAGSMHEATRAFHRGVRVLRRLFLVQPAAFGQLMGSLVSDYLGSCKAIDQEPDIELLRPIIEKLEEIQSEAE